MTIKALLIDFDNTLVLFNEDEFLVNYAEKAYPYLADYFDQSTFFQKLLQSTVNMIRNDGSITNVELFTYNFILGSNLSYEECHNRLRKFYTESFRQLGNQVHIVPYGRKLIKRVLQEGLQVVIATNPIFPELATQIRLEWANLGDLDITMSTHAENMSYCKPRPEYYQSILNHIKQKPEDCLMAGNDPISDMAASVLGIKTFLVDLDQEKGRLGILSKEIEERTKKKAVYPQYPVDGSGTLQDLERFLFGTKR
ncbi:MAG: HAD family hydrolase [Candidatus Hermodarchaeota archaeon]